MTSGDLVFKTTYSQPVESTASAENPTSWWEWTIQRLDAEVDAVTESVGRVIGEERQRRRQEVAKALEPLRHQLVELRAQIDTLIRLSGSQPTDLKEAIEAAKTPGPPGPQGPPGRRGERGVRGEPAPTIVSWALDRERFLAYPLLSTGKPGPILQLRGLFEQFQKETGG